MKLKSRAALQRGVSRYSQRMTWRNASYVIDIDLIKIVHIQIDLIKIDLIKFDFRVGSAGVSQYSLGKFMKEC